MATIHHSGMNINEAISYKANIKIRYKILKSDDDYFDDAVTKASMTNAT